MKDIRLSDHEVKIDIQFRPFSQCISTTSGTTTVASLHNATLWVDYIYLDTDERRQFAQISHEYLLLNKRRKVITYKQADNVYRKMCIYSAKEKYLGISLLL